MTLWDFQCKLVFFLIKQMGNNPCHLLLKNEHSPYQPVLEKAQRLSARCMLATCRANLSMPRLFFLFINLFVRLLLVKCCHDIWMLTTTYRWWKKSCTTWVFNILEQWDKQTINWCKFSSINSTICFSQSSLWMFVVLLHFKHILWPDIQRWSFSRMDMHLESAKATAGWWTGCAYWFLLDHMHTIICIYYYSIEFDTVD